MSKIKVRIEEWSNIPAQRKRELLKMTFNNGMMRDFVRKEQPIIFSAYLFDNENKGNRVGWAAYSLKYEAAMFYVKGKFRKRGAANALLTGVRSVAKRNDKKIRVFPHDWASENFLDAAAYKYPEVISSCTSQLEHVFKYGAHYSSSETNPRKPWSR